MPEDGKKNSQKGKNDAKEQRKRRGRQHAAPVEKKMEKEPTPRKSEKEPTPRKTEKEQSPKVTESEKPPYEPPGPEFYKNLKRETDEILKITEEENLKYKKKEIQSNWAKYEMPIETYEEIDEQANLGADYEVLIQAPLSVGAHFQFKHEKSWDLTTGSTPYDKYFDIDVENLTLALCTIPFYERNNIDQAIFNESEIQTMTHRATKFKQKYYNDKKYNTPDLEAQEKILNSLKSNDNAKTDEKNEPRSDSDKNNEKLQQLNRKDINLEECGEVSVNNSSVKDIKKNSNAIAKKEKKETIKSHNKIKEVKKFEGEELFPFSTEIQKVPKESIFKPQNIRNMNEDEEYLHLKNIIDDTLIDDDFDEFEKELDLQLKLKEEETGGKEKESESKVQENINDIIQYHLPGSSEQDLDKWLDDFLSS